MRKITLILILLKGCCYAQTDFTRQLTQQVWNLTEVMYHDVINPPAAARFYAYSLLTGYEIRRELSGTLTSLPVRSNLPVTRLQRRDKKFINVDLATLYGILEAGRLLIPSGYQLEIKQQALKKWFLQHGITKSILDSSIAFAEVHAASIAKYARGDGYFGLSAKTRYKLSNGDSCWRPTPPEYMAAVEPYWGTIRTFFIDSIEQFKPCRPVSFSRDSTSGFMDLSREVYVTGKNLTEEQKLIANYWDCNPFAVQFQGHMSIGLKKISPAGHWISIAGIALSEANLDADKALFLQTVVALTLHDAFASCWDEKYRSNRIRPETAINRWIDPHWKPFLQTPPFPEYSSGHSVISTAASEVLTALLNDHFSFVDTTEVYIGLPARKFSSFRSAAAEARISRLYGGIHFRDAIENGGEQGRNIGLFICKKLGLDR